MLPNNVKVFLLISLLLLQDLPGFPFYAGNKASHALTAQLMHMIFASGLGVTFPDAKSKSARNNLIVKVIKGANMLNLLEEIDAFQSRFPDGMARFDRTLLGVHLQTRQVL